MPTIYKKFYSLLIVIFMVSCADNTLDTVPQVDQFPLQLILDIEEGADLPDAEDYKLEVKLADYLPDSKLPDSEIQIAYTLTDFEGDMAGIVTIDKIIYEVEIDECVYERELEFTASGEETITGIIKIKPDTDLKTIPESVEVVFTLPGMENTTGGFTFEITDLQSSENIIAGAPGVFEYHVLDNEVAGEWELTIASAEELEAWKEIFAPLSAELNDIQFGDITGKITAVFEFEEMKWIIELTETVEVTVCKNGDMETATENKVIEIEAEYEAEESEMALEGSHVLLGEDGEAEDELDFIIEASYEVDIESGVLEIKFFKVIDEDHFEEGEELFNSESGYLFELSK